MIKTDVFRSQLPGSTILFTLVILFSSGTLASIKTDPAFSPNLIQPKIPAMLFYYNGNLVDTAVGAIQIASASGYKHLLWEDKEYPCLIE